MSPATNRGATRGRVVLLTILGALLVLSSTLLSWVTLDGGTASTSLTGSEVLRGLSPVALAAGAGAFALTLTDGWARRIVAVVILACGVAVVGMIVSVVMDPASAADGRRSTAPTTLPVGPAAGVSAGATPLGPLVAGAGATGILAGGAAALRAGRRWPSRGARPADGPSPARGARPPSAWDELSEGRDPT